MLNSQAKLSLGEHNLTVGANYSRETLNDDFYADSKKAPGIDPVTKISRDGWALFAEGQWNIDDFSLTTSARMDRDNYFGTHIHYAAWQQPALSLSVGGQQRAEAGNQREYRAGPVLEQQP